MPSAIDLLKSAARRALPHPVHRAIRGRRVAHIISGYEPRQHWGSYAGHEFELRFEDPLGEAWYDHDWPILPEIELLRTSRRLGPGARVFDIGAHQALVALIFAREVGDNGWVLAVEAEPHNARVAEANRLLNHAENLTILHAAVGDSEGTLSFAPGLNGSVDESTMVGNVEVPCVTIDGLTKQFGMPDIVFVDIEGYEGRALNSAKATIAGGAAFFVEVHPDSLIGIGAEEIIDLFADRDRLIAEDPDGDTGSHVFAPYTGHIPDGRFYLLAT